MKRAAAVALLLLMLAAFSGCLRREGRNSECRWPAEVGQASAADRDLLAEVEFAEELSIRYMDAHHGPRSGHFESHQAAGQARNRCLGSLLTRIGEARSLPPAEVFRSFGRRPPLIDLAINLPFALLCGWAAFLALGRLRARLPLADGWLAAVLVVLVSSLGFAVATVLIGEQWSTLAEMARVGNQHLSYRVGRLPWAVHRGALFTAAALLFLSMAAFRYGRTARLLR